MQISNCTIIKRIKDKYDDLSKSHKKIAEYIIENSEKAAYMTAHSLGKMLDISESTVVRFAVEVGCDGYPGLIRELKEHSKNKITAFQRLELSSESIDRNNIPAAVLKSDISRIKATMVEIDNREFNIIIEKILNAKRIFILGSRSSAALAGFLSFYFNLIFENVKLISTASASEMFEHVLNTGKDDVVIGISFPRYSRRTAKLMEYTQSRGAVNIAITDSYNSPISKCSNHILTARSDMISFIDSLTAPLSIINSLIVAAGLKREAHLFNTLHKLETIWENYQVYEKDEQDFKYMIKKGNTNGSL